MESSELSSVSTNKNQNKNCENQMDSTDPVYRHV